MSGRLVLSDVVEFAAIIVEPILVASQELEEEPQQT
jgi:hypothetical protein